MSDLLQEAMAARQSGDILLTKQLISQALVQNPRNESAWMLMSEVVDDVRLKRNCLERVLAINPQNALASSSLSKLVTSPLSPVSRGERDKPVDPPKIEKIPPFTPAFTWEGQEDQSPAMGDLTYPESIAEQPAEPVESTPTFDWANESPEPDKTIEKIFDAVSNPERASEPLPDTDFSWMTESDQDAQSGFSDSLLDDRAGYPDEMVSSPDEPLAEPRVVHPEDFSVSAEPQYGLDAFTSPGETYEPAITDYRAWDNPKSKQNRLVLLSSEDLIYAHPREADIPNILGLNKERKLHRDLLGADVGEIKLVSIQRLKAVPHKRGLTIEYKKDNRKLARHLMVFSSPEMRDEVLDAIRLRLGPDFRQSVETFSLGDKIIPPVVTLLIIAFIGWGLIAGLSMLSSLDPTQLGSVQGAISALQAFVTTVGAEKIFLVAALFILLCLIWLINNLRQPTQLIIIHQLPRR